ncbi:hypothetical protein ACP4OV_005336 [Aristida adscensionis]
MQRSGAMDELVFSAAGDDSILEFMSRAIPEQWLMDDDDVAVALNNNVQDRAAGGGFPQHDGTEWTPPPAVSSPTPSEERSTARKRGRKPGTGSIVSHVEAERQRREKLKRRFCDLRAAVPMVSRMDKASLLADAAAYIAQLRGRVEQLEAEAKRAAARKGAAAGAGLEDKLEVRMVGREAAALRLTTAVARHAAARLMGALRSLDLAVRHACVSRVGGAAATVQDAVVDVPAALQDERCLRAALLHALQLKVDDDESA